MCLGAPASLPAPWLPPEMAVLPPRPKAGAQWARREHGCWRQKALPGLRAYHELFSSCRR
jgi:hypothetical protein